MSEHDLSRRTFLLASAAATLATASANAGAGQRLSVGIVGPGGRGSSLLRTFFSVAKESGAELTAVCDLWSNNRERSQALVKELGGTPPRVFNRLEDMLQWDGLDAVIIATADHAHAQQLVQCVRAGKHVYCEKPFANRLDEANAAIEVCRGSDRVVTLGTQRRSHPQYLAAAQAMRSGVLGDVVQVDIIQNAYSPYRWRRDSMVSTLREKDVDWRAFLMGRPNRPFDPRQYLEFRLFHAFSTGIIDQWMTHMIDTVHMLTGARFPRSVAAHGGTYAWKDHRENGDTVHVMLDYPQGFMATYSCTLVNGFGSSCRVMGRNGTLEFEKDWRLSGEGVTGSKVASRDIAALPGLAGNMDQIHMRNWLECVAKGQRQTHCTAEHGYQHAVACIMADQALHTGRRQHFDEKTAMIRQG